MSPRERVTHFEGDDCPPDGHRTDLAAITAAAMADVDLHRRAGCRIEITTAGQPTDGNRAVWRCATHDDRGADRDGDGAAGQARNHVYEVLVDAWHDGADPRSLHETLGMSWERFRRWAEGDTTGEQP